jgi:plasmid stability protein
MTSNDTTSIIVRNIPKEVRNAFKAWCAKEGKTMTEAIKKFMEDSVRREQKTKQRQTL